MGCMGWDVRILYSTALAGGGRCHITCQVSLSLLIIKAFSLDQQDQGSGGRGAEE